MFTSGLRLALTPLPLIVAAALVYALPPHLFRWQRAIALVAVATTLALLVADSLAVGGGGRVQASFGEPVPGVAFLLRGDAPGLALGFAASLAALFTVVGGGVDRRRLVGVLVCLIGSLAALEAGNAVVLYGGLEIANVGTLVLLCGNRRRPGRAALATLAVEHLAALGLLAAAVQLQASLGTSEFSALPLGAVGLGISLPWAAAGAVRLLAPMVAPVRGAAGLTAAWAATAAVPTGAAVLLRLREAAGDQFAAPLTATLAAAGCVVALAGASMAARRVRIPALAGRSLCVAAAGPVLVFSGFGGSAAATAVAAGLIALELAVALSPAWELPTPSRAGRWLAAAALTVAGGLPSGFGTVAVILELSVAVQLGRSGIAVLLVLTAAAVLAAASSVRAGGAVLTGPAAHRATMVPPVAVAAAAAGLLAAVLPGAAAAAVVNALAAGGAAAAADAGAFRGPAGGWAGGYFAVALLLLGAAAAAAWRLTDRRASLRGPARSAQAGIWPVRLEPWRRARPAIRATLRSARRVDAWLIVQPQLPLVVLGALLALLLVH